MGTEFKIFSIVFMFLTIESEEKEKKIIEFNVLMDNISTLTPESTFLLH